MTKQQYKENFRKELWEQVKYGKSQGYGRKYMLGLHAGLVRGLRHGGGKARKQAGYAVAASFKAWVATAYPVQTNV